MDEQLDQDVEIGDRVRIKDQPEAGILRVVSKTMCPFRMPGPECIICGRTMCNVRWEQPSISNSGFMTKIQVDARVLVRAEEVGG